MLVIPFYIPEPFVSPAHASRALAEAAISWTSPVCRLAGLYERPAPARVHVRVRLPLVLRPGVDKLVHGQRTSIIGFLACPHPHTTLPTHQPYMWYDPLKGNTFLMTDPERKQRFLTAPQGVTLVSYSLDITADLMLWSIALFR